MTRILRAALVGCVLCSALSPALAGENAWQKIALDAVHTVFLASDPARPSTLYAATSRGLKKSLDGGTTWSDLGQTLPRDSAPNSVAVNYLNSKELYVGYEGKGIFKSQDGGNSWQAINEGLPNVYVRCIVISPKDPNLLYAGIQDGVAISTNGGKFWHMSSGFKRAVNVNCIAIDPLRPQYLYAGTGGAGVFKSIEEALENMVHPYGFIEPNMSNHAIYSDMFGIFRDTFFALRDAGVYNKHAAVCAKYWG